MPFSFSSGASLRAVARWMANESVTDWMERRSSPSSKLAAPSRLRLGFPAAASIGSPSSTENACSEKRSHSDNNASLPGSALKAQR